VPRERKGRAAPEADAEEARHPDNPSGARGLWSGSITFGLVTIPVELHSATRANRVPLRMLGPDGVPLARRYVCSKDEKPLDDAEIERGYEVEKGKFVIVTDEELEKLAPRRSRDIELARFVDRDAIDPAYFVRPYVVVPGGEQSKAYRLLAEVMESTRRAAIATFVMRGKAYAVAIFADNGILRAETLRFGDELRDAERLGIATPKKADAKRVAAFARAIAKRKKSDLAEKELSDDESERLLALARKKRKRGEDVVEAPELPDEEAAEEEAGGEVIDLLELIQSRLRESKPARPRRAKSPANRRRSA
jgi:DNA end-binding protein Ku